MEQKKFSFLEIKAKIEYFCAYQERCHQEVMEKLQKLGADYEDSQRLVTELISDNYLNEERFAEAFVSGKYRIKKWGRIKIQQHLKQKRISEYSIKKGIACIDEDEYLNNLSSLAERKYRESKGNKWEKMTKTKRFLYNRGYESDLIMDFLNRL